MNYKTHIIILLFFTVFFAVSAIYSQPRSLADALFETGDWSACRVECMRALSETPEDDNLNLLMALSEIRMNQGSVSNALSVLETLVFKAKVDGIAEIAAYELGYALLAEGDNERAVFFLKKVFLETSDSALFARSGYLLYNATQAGRTLQPSEAALRKKLMASSVLWTEEVVKECAISRERGASLTGLPGKWIIAFYRSQIRPVLGSRCSLSPSCSEYARQAFSRFGLVGFPMIADRFFREPGVVAEAARPVLKDGKTLFEDPLDDHVWWQ